MNPTPNNQNIGNSDILEEITQRPEEEGVSEYVSKIIKSETDEGGVKIAGLLEKLTDLDKVEN